MGLNDYTIKQGMTKGQPESYKQMLSFLWKNKTNNFNMVQMIFIMALISFFVVLLSSFVYQMIDKAL